MRNRILAAVSSILFFAQPILAQGVGRAAAVPVGRPAAPVSGAGAAAPAAGPSLPSTLPSFTPSGLTGTLPTAPRAAVAASAPVARSAAAVAAAPAAAAAVLPAAVAKQSAALRTAAAAAPAPMTSGSPVYSDEAQAAPAARFDSRRVNASLRRNANALGAPAWDSSGVTPRAPASQGVFSRVKGFVAALMLGAALLNPALSLAQAPARPLAVPAPIAVVAQAQPDAEATQAAVLQARDLGDALARYDASVRVIVIGDVGLGKAELQRLADSMAGKHWTAVLVQDASGLRYTDAEGRTHYGDDAVDFATGQGLYKKEGILAQTHPQTGERDGAILTIVMQQHVLLLRTADAYNARGLDGTTQFAGNLDRWAVSALKSSGDIVGAVEGTVKNVTAQLETKIAAERSSVQSSAAAAKTLAADLEREGPAFKTAHPDAYAAMAWPSPAVLRAAAAAAETQLAAGQARAAAETLAGPVSQARAALDRARGFERDSVRAVESLDSAAAAVAASEKAASSFQAEHPKSAGDLARPAVADWRASLKDAATLAKTNPAGAAAAAASVSAAARAHGEALAAFAGGADRIASAETLLAELTGRPYADAAAEALVTARQDLAAAREAYEDGSSAYAERLEAAKSVLGSAESAIARADASAASRRMWTWILLALANVLTLGAAVFLNRRAARAGLKADELFRSWSTALDVKLEAIIDGLDLKLDTYVGAESGPKARGWVGKSAELSAAIRLNAGTAKILLAAAQLVHDQVRPLLEPSLFSWGWFVNAFWPSRYEAAARRLQDEPVEFKPQDGVEAVLGTKRSWQEELYGNLAAYAPFKKSFNEVIAAFNERSQKAAEDLARLEAAVTGHGPALRSFTTALSMAEKGWQKLQTAGADDGLFLLPSMASSALAAGAAALERARVTVKTDPVGGLDGDGALADRIGQDAQRLVATVLNFRSTVFPTAAAATAALGGAAIGSTWLDGETSRLSGAAESAAAALAASDGSAKLAALDRRAEELRSRAAQASAIVADLAALRADGIAGGTASVAAAREQVGRRLGLEPETTLREKDQDPTTSLADASRRAEEAAAFLGQGKLGEAASALSAGNTAASQAAHIVRLSLQSLSGHAKTLEARRAESAGLETLAPERIVLLEGLRRAYAPSVLSLGAGDPTHPNGNGTIDDNPAEARTGMDQAAAKTEKAVTAFAAGRLLAAASLLDQADAHQDLARHRLEEILDKKTRLEAAVAENGRTLTALDSRKKQYDAEVIGDGRTMRPSLSAYDAALTDLEEARKAVKAAKGDPFKAAAALAAVNAALDKVWVSVRNDRDAYAEAGRSLEAARRAIDAAGEVSRQAANDKVADSPAITAAFGELDALGGELVGASRAFESAHGDWNAMDQTADRVTARAGLVAATLRGEIQAAQNAVSAISSAASRVREATNWSGSYGVSITGSPGSSALDSARAALRRGEYVRAKNHAESAYGSAASAISAAEAEEASRRRAEEARQRAARDAQRARDNAERQRRERANNSGGGRSGGFSGGSKSGNGRSGW
ncbi:MAG: hypothetical protein HYZ75_14575 [Elusimicrobia bacterium]|nr:hypothetical protein [Elusimicrobiota bacterium]